MSFLEIGDVNMAAFSSTSSYLPMEIFCISLHVFLLIDLQNFYVSVNVVLLFNSYQLWSMFTNFLPGKGLSLWFQVPRDSWVSTRPQWLALNNFQYGML